MAAYKRPPEILLVEDNPGDADLICAVLKEGWPQARLQVAANGEEAIACIFRHDGYADAPRPHLILLDLNLPRIPGKDVLAQVKGHPGFTDIPVIILTGSDAERDIQETSALHANCFVTKPDGHEKSLQALQAILHFWLDVARLPH